MPTMTDSTSVAANSVSDNLLAGKLYEFLPYNAVVQVLMSAGAADVYATVQHGGNVECDDQEVPGTNRFPIKEEDEIVSFAAPAGSRLVIKARNSTAGALTVRTKVNLIPL